MTEKIIFEEKSNGAWLPRNKSPTRFVTDNDMPDNYDIDATGGNCWAGDLLLTEENLIFKTKASGFGNSFDIIIPLENVPPTLQAGPTLRKYAIGKRPSFIVESVNGEVLAQFQSLEKHDEWEMAIKNQILANRRVKHRREKQQQQQQIDRARERERALDYDSAIRIWEKMGKPKEAARVRKLKADQGSVKVDQTVVHGDYVDDRDTIIKDSVVSKSNIGGGSSKMQELKELTEMKEKGLIDDDEFKQMKKEILGK